MVLGTFGPCFPFSWPMIGQAQKKLLSPIYFWASVFVFLSHSGGVQPIIFSEPLLCFGLCFLYFVAFAGDKFFTWLQDAWRSNGFGAFVFLGRFLTISSSFEMSYL